MSSYSHTELGVCVYHLYVILMPSALHFEFIIVIYSFIYLFWIHSGLAGFKRVQITDHALLIYYSDKTFEVCSMCWVCISIRKPGQTWTVWNFCSVLYFSCKCPIYNICHFQLVAQYLLLIYCSYMFWPQDITIFRELQTS